jgi:hypothetical protein
MESGGQFCVGVFGDPRNLSFPLKSQCLFIYLFIVLLLQYFLCTVYDKLNAATGSYY